MRRIVKFELNTAGRDFVVGDIHGCFSLLEKSLSRVEFNPVKDRLFSVGDLVDRGPESHRALEFLAQSWFYSVCGNHDRFVVETQEGDSDASMLWLVNGGAWWLEVTPEDRTRFREAFARLPYAVGVETAHGVVGIVHADIFQGMSWPQFLTALESGNPDAMETALWGRARANGVISAGVEGVWRVFCGHTVQENGIRRLENIFFIDTGAVYGLLNNTPNLGLTLVDLTTLETLTVYSAH